MTSSHLLVQGFLLFGSLIPRKTEESPSWKPSYHDAKNLGEELAKLQTKEVEYRAIDWKTKEFYSFKKKLHPFEQYAVSKGCINMSESGQIEVAAPTDWKKLCETYSLLQWQQGKDMEQMFQAFPEEKSAYELRLQEIFKGVRDMLGGKVVRAEYAKGN